MNLLGRFAAKSRIRKAVKALATEPTARGYVNLAREYVVAGSVDEVQRVCLEGLELFPGNPDLNRLNERARQLQLDERIKVLESEYNNAPRSAIYRELSETLISAGRAAKAQKIVDEWKAKTGEPEACYYHARIAFDRFLADRRAADGSLAFEQAREAFVGMPGDPRPLQLQLDIATRAGAWQDARRIIARLLEFNPGDRELEVRFRQILPLTEKANPLERCLLDVERTGLFTGDQVPAAAADETIAVRPLLRKLDADQDVRAAIFIRGGTALVQGPRGATANRTARVVREMVSLSQSTARRLGLGEAVEVRLEGDFGSLLLSPGELGSSALWCQGPIKRQHETLLRNLSGMADSDVQGGNYESAA